MRTKYEDETDKYVVLIAGFEYNDERYYEVGDCTGQLNSNCYFNLRIEAETACTEAWRQFFTMYELESFSDDYEESGDYRAQLWNLDAMKRDHPELVELLPEQGPLSKKLTFQQAALLKGYWLKMIYAWVETIKEAAINDIR